MNPKVSILIPVYKVSAYIERCAHSLFNQTFSNIEFIFVNDATPDDSIEKLNALIKLYPNLNQNIRILHHKKNIGTAEARYTALKVAKGEFILFVDSDDYIDTNMIEIMYNKAICENADIVVSDMFIEFKSKSIKFNDYLPSNKEDQLRNIISNQKSTPSLCNKLVKKTIYQSPLIFHAHNMSYMEDRYMCFRIYYLADIIVKINQPFYHYIKYNSYSSTKTINSNHFTSMIYFWKSLEEFLQENKNFDKFADTVNLFKIKDKSKLMLSTNSISLQKKYAHIFSNEESLVFSKLKEGEKLILFFIRNKMFIAAQLLRKVFLIKTILINTFIK
ncbi:MAG: glycosyltransferase family 2 protein [Paludibacter sp.]